MSSTSIEIDSYNLNHPANKGNENLPFTSNNPDSQPHGDYD